MVMSKKIKVLVLEAEKEDSQVMMKGSDLASSQKLVGGYIECVGLSDDIDLWLNEEGKLDGLKPNFNLVYNNEVRDVVVGNVFFASHDDEGDTTSLSEGQLKSIENMFINRRNLKLG
jgi:hypothetical protein